MTLYLIDNKDNIIKTVIPGSRFQLPSEGKEKTFVSPAYEGWTNGTYTLKNIPDPEPEKPTVEQIRESLECSRLQAKAILYQYGLLDQVETIINGSDFIVQLAWKEAQVIKRNSPLVVSLKERLVLNDGSSMTDEQLDEMFMAARQLQF